MVRLPQSGGATLLPRRLWVQRLLPPSSVWALQDTGLLRRCAEVQRHTIFMCCFARGNQRRLLCIFSNVFAFDNVPCFKRIGEELCYDGPLPKRYSMLEVPMTSLVREQALSTSLCSYLECSLWDRILSLGSPTLRDKPSFTTHDVYREEALRASLSSWASLSRAPGSWFALHRRTRTWAKSRTLLCCLALCSFHCAVRQVLNVYLVSQHLVDSGESLQIDRKAPFPSKILHQKIPKNMKRTHSKIRSRASNTTPICEWKRRSVDGAFFKTTPLRRVQHEENY